MAYRVVVATGLLGNRAEWPAHLSSLETSVRDHNAVPARLPAVAASWPAWTVEGRWWVYEDRTTRCLEFTPARRGGNPKGIRILGSMTVEADTPLPRTSPETTQC